MFAFMFLLDCPISFPRGFVLSYERLEHQDVGKIISAGITPQTA